MKGVIFDLDGLLFDTEKIYYEANQAAADKMGLPYSEAYYHQFIGVSDAELHEAYAKDFAAYPPELVEQFLELGYATMRRKFRAGEAPLKPGAVELLRWLAHERIPAVIATSNTRDFVDILLAKNALASYFKEIISAENVKKAKPDPEIVRKAVSALGVSKGDCIMLEDSLNGVRAAYAAEVPVIVVPDLVKPTEETHEKAQIILENLHEVKDYLANLRTY